MKTFGLVAFMLSMSSSVWASHFILCDIEAKVTDVQNLARMDGVAIFREGIEDYDQVVTVEVTKVVQEGRSDCLPVGEQSLLTVKKEQQGQYKKNQVLNLTYQNVGDALGSRISWTVNE